MRRSSGLKRLRKRLLLLRKYNVKELIKIQKELDFDESPDSIVDMVPGEKTVMESKLL